MKTRFGTVAIAATTGIVGIGAGVGIAAHFGIGINAAAEEAPTSTAEAFLDEEPSSIDAEGNEYFGCSDSSEYPIGVNSKGQTYGSLSGLCPEFYPDLVSVSSDSGGQGYVPKEFFLEQLPSSPKEAVEISRSMAFGQAGLESTPVFDSEGTIIEGEVFSESPVETDMTD